jgi:protein-S-isoprenylcysteine O-methyltransferase Ste14
MSDQLPGTPRRSTLPPLGLLYSLLAQLPLVVATWPPSPGAWHLAAGAAILVAGVVLTVWPERMFRRARVGVCPFSAVPRLVTGGPYRISRNPMYLGFVSLSAGVAVASGVLGNLWAAAALGVWLHWRFVLPEEDFLYSQLGDKYIAYRDTHPRWLGFGSRGAGQRTPSDTCMRAQPPRATQPADRPPRRLPAASGGVSAE